MATVQKLLDWNEEMVDSVLEKLEEAKDWALDALRQRRAWRMHLAIYLHTLATGFGNPITYAALVSSLRGQEDLNLYEEAHRLWINSLSLTAFVGAGCTIFWFSAGDCVSRKKILVIAMLLRAMQFIALAMLLSGALGSWSRHLWYIASIIEGINPSETINVEWIAWMDFTEGSEEMRSQTIVLIRIFAATAAGFGTGFSLFFLQMGLFQVTGFTLIYSVLACMCLASVGIMVGLQFPSTGKKPDLSVSNMIVMAREMLHLFRDPYNFWAIIRHCVSSAMAFRGMVVPTFCFVHYGWSQDAYMLVMMIPSLGSFCGAFGPKLMSLMGEMFFAIYFEILNFLFFEVLGLFLPIDSTIFIMQQVLHTPVREFNSLSQQDVRARVPYNRPEVRGRSAALFTGLGKVVVGLSSKIFDRSGIFDPWGAKTYQAQVAPFIVVFVLGLISRLIYIFKLWTTECEILTDLYCERRGLVRVDEDEASVGERLAQEVDMAEPQAKPTSKTSKKSKKSKKTD